MVLAMFTDESMQNRLQEAGSSLKLILVDFFEKCEAGAMRTLDIHVIFSQRTMFSLSRFNTGYGSSRTLASYERNVAEYTVSHLLKSNGPKLWE